MRRLRRRHRLRLKSKLRLMRRLRRRHSLRLRLRYKRRRIPLPSNGVGFHRLTREIYPASMVSAGTQILGSTDRDIDRAGCDC